MKYAKQGGEMVKRMFVNIYKALRKLVVDLARDPRVVVKWWDDIKKATKHTVKWVITGSKLFGANLRVSKQLLHKKLLGHPLTLRESKLLVRTMTDCFKIIPFSFFIIVPFAELALPLALRIFPNMLPSTFFEQSYDDAYLAKKLRAKQELAAFFQDMVKEKAKQLSDKSEVGDKAALLESFVAKMVEKDEDDRVPFLGVKETLQVARHFKEEFKPEKWSLKSLQTICKLLGIQPYGLHSHVVLQIRHHVLKLKTEDREILWEGVENLNREELIEANKARAMTFFGISDEDMREQLRIWLELSSHRDIPPLLLIWSRCMSLTHSPLPIGEKDGQTAGEVTVEGRAELTAVPDARTEAERQKALEREEAARAAEEIKAAQEGAEVQEEERGEDTEQALKDAERRIAQLNEDEAALKASISELKKQKSGLLSALAASFTSSSSSSPPSPPAAPPVSDEKKVEETGEKPSPAASPSPSLTAVLDKETREALEKETRRLETEGIIVEKAGEGEKSDKTKIESTKTEVMAEKTTELVGQEKEAKSEEEDEDGEAMPEQVVMLTREQMIRKGRRMDAELKLLREIAERQQEQLCNAAASLAALLEELHRERALREDHHDGFGVGSLETAADVLEGKEGREKREKERSAKGGPGGIAAAAKLHVGEEEKTRLMVSSLVDSIEGGIGEIEEMMSKALAVKEAEEDLDPSFYPSDTEEEEQEREQPQKKADAKEGSAKSASPPSSSKSVLFGDTDGGVQKETGTSGEKAEANAGSPKVTTSLWKEFGEAGGEKGTKVEAASNLEAPASSQHKAKDRTRPGGAGKETGGTPSGSSPRGVPR
uniref:Letm1 RBD domain-containing protein n=1 Tax=Chromera velia CCMP2878 TaxID=1169474 RepID=A0A0G4FXR7_9ALVE|eukprot:Cvel_19312.t1-p1 / transcript=Cvel_19312.t1 / gene=Cvel_19312 / organism=Chromera_velia_CCMP2878 / gene_product=LETM1 domain-containing protein LETM2,, putative / transcript_product=LETM1 domain-containing protein LETM2,, putative / location=Cvel_scaffold1655:17317-23390(-) / protein_length=830 / sequence_SO=supercontig / SO=protein_coding / is_pseudo=false